MGPIINGCKLKGGANEQLATDERSHDRELIRQRAALTTRHQLDQPLPNPIMQTQHAIDWHNPQCLVSKYFSVAEVTQGDDRRIPAPGSEEELNILYLAADLDLLREAWGNAICVTSWYRPYEINLAVGGVENSQHITGAAVDIYPANDAPHFEDWLDSKWGGALGYGQASGRGFTHIDLRGGGFERGAAEIRWFY